MTTEADRIRTWTDKSELGELVARLSSAVDRGDYDTIAECYSEESFDDHGGFKGSGREFAEILRASGGDRVTHHLLGHSLFSVHGDEAWGETFFVFHGLSDGSVQRAFGRYVDFFERVEGRWKVKYRRVVPDHTFEGDEIGRYPTARRDRSDPIFDQRRWPLES